MDSLKDNNIRMIDISDKNNYKIYKSKECSISKPNHSSNNQQHEKLGETSKIIQQQEQTFILTDIPIDFDANRIKGALKPFGKIHNLQIT